MCVNCFLILMPRFFASVSSSHLGSLCLAAVEHPLGMGVACLPVSFDLRRYGGLVHGVAGGARNGAVEGGLAEVEVVLGL